MTGRRLTGVVAVLGLAGCCPTLWLTVTKGDPIPRGGVPLPEIDRTPIVAPPKMTNQAIVEGRRFEVSPKFSDHPDPHDDRIHAISNALEGLDQLARFGIRHPLSRRPHRPLRAGDGGVRGHQADRRMHVPVCRGRGKRLERR